MGFLETTNMYRKRLAALALLYFYVLFPLLHGSMSYSLVCFP